jgi:hypothetical protein
LRTRLTIVLGLLALAAGASIPADAQQSTGVAELPIVDAPVVAPMESFAFAGQEVTRTLADTWHRTGRTGAGVTIGIITTGDDGLWRDAARLHELPGLGQVPQFCRINGLDCADRLLWFAGPRKGVAVAEVVHDMAPDARLAVAFAGTAADLEEVVDWFVQQGVDVVLRPQTDRFDGPGDGTGPIDAALDHAVQAGMTVVQTVGESGAGSYYRWTFADADHDGWVEFNDAGDERLLVTGCDGYARGMRWDDFGEGDDMSDYDLYTFQPGGTVPNGSSIKNQAQGFVPPIEELEPCGPFDSAELGVEVQDPGAATEGDVFEILGSRGLTFEYSTAEGSASGPGEDSANPGVVTVAALTAADSGLISPTASRGPTPSGGTSPDLTAGSCLSTYSFVHVCVGGAEASAAVVAGAAALYRGEHPEATPADVAAWLAESAAEDRGAPGVDDVYGAGELILPSMGARARYRPDARVRGSAAAGLVGDGRYNSSGVRQAATLSGRPEREVRFTVTLQNDGNAPERFLVSGSSSAYGYRIRYYRNGSPITSILSGRYSTPVVAPGRTTPIEVRVRIPRFPTVGGVRGIVQVVSQTTLQLVDTVRYNALVRF